MVDPSESFTADSWLDRLSQVHGVRMLFIVLAGSAYTVPVDGVPGAVIIDGAAPDLFEQLDREAVFSAAAAGAMLDWAVAATNRGVELRQEHKLADAYVYRFALVTAVRLNQPAGVAALVGNVWTLRQAVRDVTVRARGPSRVLDEDEQGVLAEFERSVRWTAQAMRDDAAALSAAIASIMESSEVHPGEAALTLYRLARVSGDDERRRVIQSVIFGSVEDADRTETAFLAVVEDICEMQITDVLVAAGVIEAESDPSARDMWTWYMALRSRVDEASNARELAERLHVAFGHLSFVRLNVTAAGGTFGHRLSFIVSEFRQQVGRDLVTMLRRLGSETEALLTAEHLLARASTDWMRRAHPSSRIPREFTAYVAPVTGSMNAAEPAAVHPG